MSKTFRIVHLSDLHCDSSKEWNKQFEYAESLINDRLTEPNLIALTGDAVNSPSDKHFNHLKKRIVNLCKDRFQFLIVPGNHDYYLLGNRVFNNKSKCYDNFIKKLYDELNESPDAIRKKIFVDHGIAIYTLDSNLVGRSSFAQGIITHPSKTLNSHKEFFENINSKIFQTAFKIAMLHHHPITPGNHSQKILHAIQDAGLKMLNFHSFLEEAFNHDLHLIIHGHRHRSGAIKIDFSKMPGAIPSLGFAVSSCGSSSKKKNESFLEIKVYDVIDRRTCDMFVYRRKVDEDSDFRSISDCPKRLVRETQRRMQLCLTTNNEKPVERARAKTKMVQILDSGSANVEIQIYGLKFKGSEGSVEEIIRSDYGRLVWGQYAFAHKKLAFLDEDVDWISWENPAVTDNIALPYEKEAFEYSFDLDKDVCGEKRNLLRIRYHHQNGYALTDIQSKETYKTESGDPRKEFCSIYADFPVEELELTVRFPNYTLFPLSSSFRLEVHKFPSADNNKRDISIPLEEMDKKTHERDYLDTREALRIRSFYDEVTLNVRNPLPDHLYSITWEPIEDIFAYKTKSAEDLLIDELRSDFYHGAALVNTIRDELQEELRQRFNDQELVVFIVGYDAHKKKMRVSSKPDLERFKICHELLPGRGAAGAAFIRRDPIYWDNKIHQFSEFDAFEDQISFKIERVVEGLEPEAVLAIPLAYPWHFLPQEIFLKEDVDEEVDFLSNIKSHHSFAAVSIVTEKKDSDFILTTKYRARIDYNNYEGFQKMLSLRFKEIDELTSKILVKQYGKFVQSKILPGTDVKR